MMISHRMTQKGLRYRINSVKRSDGKLTTYGSFETFEEAQEAKRAIEAGELVVDRKYRSNDPG